jgi:tryptophanase
VSTIFEPFRIKSVEPLRMTTLDERRAILERAHWNLFRIPAEDILIDLLTDSGTGAMSAEQWGGIMRGDESYAGARSWYRFRDRIREITGFKQIIPTHQGRAAERILFSCLGVRDRIVISNTHFDTTRANVEYQGGQAIDIPVPEALEPSVEHPFKGNIDLAALERLLEEHRGRVACVIQTVTNNSGGGQPASMELPRRLPLRGERVLHQAARAGIRRPRGRVDRPRDVLTGRRCDVQRQEGRPGEHRRFPRQQ